MSSNINNNSNCLHYTAHPNWEWVLQATLQKYYKYLIINDINDNNDNSNSKESNGNNNSILDTNTTTTNTTTANTNTTNNKFKLIHEKCMKDLPSQYIYSNSNSSNDLQQQHQLAKKRKSTYSLFRLELVCKYNNSTSNSNNNNSIDIDNNTTINDSLRPSRPTITHCCWMSGQMFGFLDAKDALVRHLKRADEVTEVVVAEINAMDISISSNSNSSRRRRRKPSDAMPRTVLLAWDYDPNTNPNSDTTSNPNSTTDFQYDLPSTPTCLLKAALGSGGFGIYFIHNKAQVESLLQRDAIAARVNDYFIPGLKRDHGGCVPDWSLQQYIESVRVFPERARCQFRVYAISVYNRDTDKCHMYMYDTVEVRVPRWDIDLDEVVCNMEGKSDILEPIVPLNGVDSVDPLGTGDLIDNYPDPDPTSDPAKPGNKPDLEPAKPAMEYNTHRNKAKTYRYILEEMPHIEQQTQTQIHTNPTTKSTPVTNTTPTNNPPPPIYMQKGIFHDLVSNTLLDLQPAFMENLEKNLKNTRLHIQLHIQVLLVLVVLVMVVIVVLVVIVVIVILE